LQLLPEYQVAHERAVYKAIAIVADTKKVVQNINIDKLHELRAMQKPIIDIEDLMAAIIMICESLLEYRKKIIFLWYSFPATILIGYNKNSVTNAQKVGQLLGKLHEYVIFG